MISVLAQVITWKILAISDLFFLGSISILGVRFRIPMLFELKMKSTEIERLGRWSIVQERLLGAALGTAFTGFLVFEQRKCIYRSISDAQQPQLPSQFQVKLFRVLRGSNPRFFPSKSNQKKKENFGTLYVFSTCDRHFGCFAIDGYKNLALTQLYLFVM